MLCVVYYTTCVVYYTTCVVCYTTHTWQIYSCAALLMPLSQHLIVLLTIQLITHNSDCSHSTRVTAIMGRLEEVNGDTEQKSSHDSIRKSKSAHCQSSLWWWCIRWHINNLAATNPSQELSPVRVRNSKKW